MDILDRVFWLRIGFAVIAGLVAGGLGFLSFNENAANGIGIGFLFYLISYIVARGIYGKIIPSTDKNKLITTGIGAYVFMFLFIWILYNTIFVQTGGEDVGI
ncbi:MAG: hypothetical protein KatS3mg003_0346 [Candidatus Nitrosocaldaceae archaeon]|nr:MAG: hypothetical protein KatS3mg003_0346 [Candidatus Nitrosocaldaceae archaeon]